MELSLPLPPSANHYYRRVGDATLISREGRRYREAVAGYLAALRVRPLAGRLWVRVVLYPPDRRRRDLDNVLKCLLDALAKGGAYADDSQIDRLDISRGPVTEGGGVHVLITEV